MRMILFLFCITPVFIVAQPTDTTRIFHSSTYDKERTIDIVLPSGYDPKDTSTLYITAYLFDGQWHAYRELVSATCDYYATVGQGVPMILVNIHSDNRSLEFTPHWNHQQTYDGWRGNCGQADTLTWFLRTEVIPWVEQHYNTNGYRLGVGHSLGGTYVINELMKDNSLFQGVIAVSPNLVYDEKQLIDTAGLFFAQTTKDQRYLYASAGDAPGMESMFRAGVQELDSIIQALQPGNLHWKTRYLDGDDHMSTFPTTFNYAYLDFSTRFALTENDLMTLCEDTSEQLLDLILEKYKGISDFAGFEIAPGVNDWNGFGYAASYSGRNSEAIELFDFGIASFPKDHNLHDSKAEVLQRSGQHTEARQSYQKALDVLEQVKNELDPEDYIYYRDGYTSRRDAISDSLIAYSSWIEKAKAALQKDNYKEASRCFDKAFTYNIIRATHLDRKLAAGAFSMAGKTNKAFEQLDLLASRFKWRGKKVFEEDEHLIPLHADERWKPLMDSFEKNLE